MSCFHCGSTSTLQFPVDRDGRRVSVCVDPDECRRNRTSGAAAGSEHSEAPAAGEITGGTEQDGGAA
jgi:hypothetical protein